jgi:hypothetical protein
MKRRLFVFGCSYTFFMWPTWADLLSVEYDDYENWGWVGIGNRAIAERVAEAHAKHNFTTDDTVIVQWSTTLRHDWHNELAVNSEPGWQTNGNAFSPKNIKFYDEAWYRKFFSERSWVMHTLNHILLTQGLLDTIGCTWRMTAIGDIRNLGTDLDRDLWNYERVSLDSKELSNNFILWNRYPEFLSYGEQIWNKYPDKWIDPIMPYASKYDELYWWFQAKHDKEAWKEGHPSPLQHQRWVNELLRPSLGFKDIPSQQQAIVDTCVSLKSNPEFMDCLRFEKFLQNKQHTLFDTIKWPNIKKGF